ncbi:HEAT repeat domain-containing protein [Pontiellaceae bacterium B12219]|nr:HEAT repeat domain-containing protein [Pontiellaceae bacterium B12219]
MKVSTAGYASILLGLMVGLSGCGYETQSEAIQAWKQQGKTEKIIKLLYDPQQGTRIEAINALAELQAKEAIEPLGSLFNDPDKIVVHEAIDGVIEIGGPEIEPYMLEAVALDTVPARVSGATALGNFKSPEAVDALIIALDDYKFEQVVLAAIESLGQIGDPRAVEPLCAKLKERSYNIREACIHSLYKIGNEAAIAGIATRLGDVQESIRNEAIKALQDNGATSLPFALEALRSENHFARASALQVLAGIEAVPESGSDLVWYRLAELTTEEKTEIDPAKAEVFASIEDSVPELLNAVMYTSPGVREYAFIALENIGESATEPAVVLAEEQATPKALAWFNQRSEWSGAPSWRVDLWAALTALNPKFRINQVYVELMAKNKVEAAKVMTAEQFRPTREMIPYILFQLAGTESEDEDKVKQTERCQTLAKQSLTAAGYQAVLPLVAALNADDAEIAIRSAQILNASDDARVEEMVIAEYVHQMDAGTTPVSEEIAEADENAVEGETAEGEEAEVAVQRNPAEELSGTSLHLAMLEFDYPELAPMLAKIRPVSEVAIWAFKNKYPDMVVISLPLTTKVDPSLNAVPFRLSYYKNNQMNELRVVYRLNRAGDWVLNPPIPDELP